jgi:hypothetical protein
MNTEKLNELKKLLRILLDSKKKLNVLLENYCNDNDDTESNHLAIANDCILTASDNIAAVMLCFVRGEK